MKTVNKMILLALTLCIAGCSNFEELNTNPNGATSVTPGMLATTLIVPVASGTGGYNQVRNKYMISIERTTQNMNAMYNNLGRWDLNDLATLRNVDKMVASVPEGTLRNSYAALGHFVRAYRFFDHTMRMGDIPYSEAIKGESAVYYPAYDEQKTVFAGILDELDEADRLFAEGVKFDGDPFTYKGDPAQWRKLVNAFELRVLINLHKRAGDTPELKVKERFQEIVSQRPLPASNDDNYQLEYSDAHRYSYYKLSDNGSNNRYITSFIIDTLKLYNDRRLYYYANPTAASVATGIPANTPEAYAGVNSLENFADVSNIASRLNQRYTERPEGEPACVIGYAEVNLILAEAAARGFISGNAREYYEKGIRASMNFTDRYTPDEANFHHNMKLSDSYINTYLQSPGVAFAATPAEQIHQIAIQKFISSFVRDNDMAWFETRRTGYPAIPVNPETNLNIPSDRMPVRWMYPENEYTNNGENVKAAVARQFSGTDDSNGVMWILK